MDIGKAFTFVFEDEKWIAKLLVAAAILLLGLLFSWLLLIPLLVAAAILLGYGVEIMRRVMHGHLDGLPEWDDWSKLIAEGFRVLVILLVYALPAIVVSICVGVPIGLFAERAGWLSSMLNALLSLFNVLWGWAIALVLPAAVALYVATDDIGAAFRFREVFALVRDNFTTYAITFLMSLVASVVGSLGAIVCGIGWFATAPYGWIVTAHLYGQAYLESKGPLSQAVLAEEAT
jgi:hypothetical protein